MPILDIEVVARHSVCLSDQQFRSPGRGSNGPIMHARIGVLRARNWHVERVFTDRKDHHWGKRKAGRIVEAVIVSLLQQLFCSFDGTEVLTPHALKLGSLFDYRGWRIDLFITDIF
jgi:hypothetical protein